MAELRDTKEGSDAETIPYCEETPGAVFDAAWESHDADGSDALLLEDVLEETPDDASESNVSDSLVLLNMEDVLEETPDDASESNVSDSSDAVLRKVEDMPEFDVVLESKDADSSDEVLVKIEDVSDFDDSLESDYDTDDSSEESSSHCVGDLKCGKKMETILDDCVNDVKTGKKCGKRLKPNILNRGGSSAQFNEVEPHDSHHPQKANNVAKKKLGRKPVNPVLNKEIWTESETGFKCAVCGKTFQHVNHVYDHSRVHTMKTTNTRYPCPQCDKGFYFAAHLRKHLRSHTGETPYNCSICNKGFRHTSHLKRHQLCHMGEAGKFHCDICGNKVVDIYQHMKSHLGIRIRKSLHSKKGNCYHPGDQLNCGICPKRYTRPSQLKRHMKTHTGDLSYHCDLCTKSFVNGLDLVRHRNVHLKIKPFPCKVCDHRLCSLKAFKTHMKMLHEDVGLGDTSEINEYHPPHSQAISRKT